MNPGRFDRRIEIQQATQGKTTHGARSITYSTYATVWAERVAETIQEGVPGPRKVVASRYRFSMHLVPGINESYRIKDETEYFDIVSVDTTADKLFTIIRADKVIS